ncbi:SH3 beta-barrel fold-containing protein [uncultured Alistipes sp.]|uniref:SH3 beta-barrel fold-containing protein n=1 Tax=uncultured Alistipes sp. TaxID=538949 RepID=UPI0026201F9E|nr:SH3 beta-barrel fold-containing protein [uncultured Alistipes sp.]
MNTLIITEMTATRMEVIAARTQNLLVAGAKAMMIESLKEKLRSGVAHFIYIKKNGEVREAWGTTSKSLIEKYINGKGCSRESYSTTAYFDIEKGAWRSLRWESIVKVF